MAASNAERVCDGLMEAGWLGALILLPLLFNVYSETRYEPDKVVMLRSIAALGGGAAAVGMVVGRRVRPRSGLRVFGKSPFAGAALLMAFAYVLGSLVSVAPRVSWLGSYARQQGTLTLFCYLVLFFLVLSRFRRAEQWERMSFAVLVASVPIAAHAIAEQLRLDPLGMSELSARSTGTSGNPIFLSAYLGFAIFMSLERLLAGRSEPGRRDAPPTGRKVRHITGIRTATYVAILLLQFSGFAGAQSRGPAAGLLAGLFVFATVGLIRWKRHDFAGCGFAGQASGVGAPRWPRNVRRWAWTAPMVVAALLISLLTVALIPDSPLASARRLPYLGRLSRTLDFESGTAQVRILIWRGISDLFADPARRLPPPAVDPSQYLRAPVGYGPETLLLVFPRFYPPELGPRQGWGTLPDRAHSEFFDALVSAGLLGAVAVVGLFVAVFFRCLVWLLEIDGKRDRRRLLTVLLVGPALGFVGPWALTGSIQFAAAGVPLGLLVGLVLWTMREGFRPLSVRPRGALPAGLVLALFSALVAHWVEISVGIAIVTTRAYFWLLLGVLAVAGSGRLEWSRGEGSSGKPEDPGRPEGQGGSEGRGAPARSNKHEEPSHGYALTHGLLCGTAITTLVFDFFAYSPGDDTTRAVLSDSLIGRADGPPGVLWLLVLTWAAGLLLAFVERPAVATKVTLRVFAIASLLPPAAFGWLHARSLAQAAGLGGEGPSIRLAMHLASLFSVFHAVAITLLVATGVALAAGRGRSSRLGAVFVSVAPIAGVLAFVWVVATPGLRAVSADVFVHQGKAVAAAGQFELATLLGGRALELRPLQDSYFFFRGNAYFEWARQTADDNDRERRFESAFADITRAAELNPFDASHQANLGRILMSQGATIADPESRRSSWLEADRYFDKALQLYPQSAVFVAERAQLRQLLSSGLSARGPN